jgi:predicted phosphodiesterase
VRERVRLAVFGGVYSNRPALDQVLRDTARAGAGVTWCLGDLGGFGPRPDEAIERVREAGIPVLMGNYDDAIGHGRDDCACGYTDPRDARFAQIAYDYTSAGTSPEHRAWLRGLPRQVSLEIGGRNLLLCHGSPRRVNEFLWDSTCSDAFLEWLCRAHEADVVLCTHTGLHWHRALPSGRHVVNVGAVGRPANDGRPGAWYAVLTFDRDLTVAFRHVGYDHAAYARVMRDEGLPDEFVETIQTGWWTTCLENMPAQERRRGRW